MIINEVISKLQRSHSTQIKKKPGVSAEEEEKMKKRWATRRGSLPGKFSLYRVAKFHRFCGYFRVKKRDQSRVMVAKTYLGVF